MFRKNARKKASKPQIQNKEQNQAIDPDAPPRRTSLPYSKLKELERNWSRLAKQRALSPLIDFISLEPDLQNTQGQYDFAANIVSGNEKKLETETANIMAKLEEINETKGFLEKNERKNENFDLLSLDNKDDFDSKLILKTPKLPLKSVSTEIVDKEVELPIPITSRSFVASNEHELGLKIELDQPNYQAGQILKGKLMVQCLKSGNPLSITYIHVHFKGIESIFNNNF